MSRRRCEQTGEACLISDLPCDCFPNHGRRQVDEPYAGPEPDDDFDPASDAECEGRARDEIFGRDS